MTALAVVQSVNASGRQSGQAMTEFVVSVSFVFLVLFVAVPTFGKILDLQFQTQQASRYVAWERTVWYESWDRGNDNQDDFAISSSEFESLAIRSDEEVMDSLRNRFFYGHGSTAIKSITEDDTTVGNTTTSPVWTYVQSGNSMYGGTTLVDNSLDEQDTPSIAYDFLDFVQTGLDAVTGPLNAFLNFFGGDEDFMTINGLELDGYYRPTITTQLAVSSSHGGGTEEWDRQVDGSMGRGIESMFFQNWDGALTAHSAILAEGWNAQSEHHYKERADDLVLTTLFDNDVFEVVKTIASILEGGPSNSAIDKLEFGAVGIEPMPTNDDGEPLEHNCEDGFCDF